MFKTLKLLLVTFFLFGIISNTQAEEVFAYIKTVARKQDKIENERAKFCFIIENWRKGAEVLFTHIEKTRAVFFNKYTVTAFFAGEESKVSSFLSVMPYEGDFLKEIYVKFNYVSLDKDGKEINTVFTRKYNNIRYALKVIKDKDNKAMWEYLAENRKYDYANHKNNGDIKNGMVNVVFYNMQPKEENRLFGISFTEEKDNQSK